MAKILKYIEKLEQREFAENDGLSKAISDLSICTTDRTKSGFDSRAEMGVRIMKNELELGVKGDRPSKRQFVNIIDKALKRKTAELQSADINIELKNEDGTRTDSQRYLENETVYSFDRNSVVRIADQAISNMNFMNWGVVRTYWDTYSGESWNWRTGRPRMKLRDPRKIFVNPGCVLYNLKDAEQIFDVENFNTERLKKLFPELKDKINPSASEENQVKRTSRETTNLVYYQYFKPYILEGRSIIDNDKPEIENWLEPDYQEYLKQIMGKLRETGNLSLTINTLAEDLKLDELREKYENADELEEAIEKYKEDSSEQNTLDVLDLLCQENDENVMFTEKVIATKKKKTEYRVWFEIQFVLQDALLLAKPHILKDNSYAILPGDGDPDYSYPISAAFKGSNLMEMYNELLTLECLYTIRFSKPKWLPEPGALLNEADFLKNYAEPNCQPQIDPEWRETHSNIPLDKIIQKIDPLDISKAVSFLENRLQIQLEGHMRAQKVQEGRAEYSGQSGEAIKSLQYSAKLGDRTDLYKLEDFFTKICETLKNLIAEHKDGIPHQVEELNDQDEREMKWVNTDEDNQLIDAINCFVRVKLEDSMELVAQKKKNEAFEGLKSGLFTKIRAIRHWGPENTDEIIKEIKVQDETLRFMDLLEGVPDNIKEQVIQTLQQVKGQQEIETAKPEEKKVLTNRKTQGMQNTAPEGD